MSNKVNLKKKVKVAFPTSSIETSVPKHVEEESGNDGSVPINLEDSDDDGSVKNTSSRLTSWVWPHYERFTVFENKMVGGVLTKITKEKARCKHCKTKTFAVGSNTIGTTTLASHLKKKCIPYKRSIEAKEKGQTVLTGDKSEDNKLVFRAFNQTDVTTALIEMIVVDEMPFSTVDKPGFQKFCSIAIPEYDVPSRRLFMKQFFRMYESCKNGLRKELASHRISLTTDTWTSVQTTNYMVITAHFIDSGWNMHKRILNFSQIENHQGASIGKVIENCLQHWKITQVLTITVDNAAVNKSALEWLKARMIKFEYCSSLMGGKYLHVRCTAHIVNLIVGHGLKILNKPILAIRNVVTYVRSSPQRLTAFKGAVLSTKIPCRGLVMLDVSTRWNSTYLMLQATLTFRKAFEYLDDEDPLYRAYFGEPEEDNDLFEELELDGAFGDGLIATTRTRKRVGPPAPLDWEKAEVFVEFLELFYEITLRVSSSLKPTANSCFHDIMLIEKKLREMYVPITDHSTQARTEVDSILSTMALSMTLKYEKYFGRHSDMNQLLLVALFLDPRFKLTSLEHLLLESLAGSDPEIDIEAEVKRKKCELICLVKDIYNCYKPSDGAGPSQSPSSVSTLTSADTTKTKGTKRKNLKNLLGGWKVDDDDMVHKHEVDKYLSDKLERFDVDDDNDDDELDILCWWKINSPKYPILAAMAKDVLAIQVSTVASESAFSTGGRIVDTSRSSLTPATVEALICLQNWLKADTIVSYIKDEPSIEAYEFYEHCEATMALSPAESANCDS